MTLTELRERILKWCEDDETRQILRWHEALNMAEQLRDYSQREMAREILDGLHLTVPGEETDEYDDLADAILGSCEDSDADAVATELEQFIAEAKAEG